MLAIQQGRQRAVDRKTEQVGRLYHNQYLPPFYSIGIDCQGIFLKILNDFTLRAFPHILKSIQDVWKSVEQTNRPVKGCMSYNTLCNKPLQSETQCSKSYTYCTATIPTDSLYPQDTPSSPLKTVLDSLATGPTQPGVTSRTQRDTHNDKIPTRIEEVPFR